jgi:gentisate 1,2-dioxygenase
VVARARFRGRGPTVRARRARLFERVAPGDRIPLHTHSTNEVVIVDRGTGEYRLGDDTREVRVGSIVFVPAGTAHGTRKLGDGTLDIHAIFPSGVIDITMIERNPAPGTEDDPPRHPLSFDPRAGTTAVTLHAEGSGDPLHET